MRQNPAAFGWEKLCFLAATAALSAAAYYFLTSCPVTLRPGIPVSLSETQPVRVAERPLSSRSDEESYVYSGTDPQSGLLANRDRMRPFEPYPTPVIAEVKQQALTPIPGPPLDPGAKPAPAPREFAAVDLASAVEYKGVMWINGLSYGLLNRTDGSGYLSVKEGSTFSVGNESYRVERLEKQAICVSCGVVCVVLKNTRFDAEAPQRPARSHGTSRAF